MKLDNHTRMKVEGFNKPLNVTWQHKLLQKHLTSKSKLLDIGCAAGRLSQVIKNKDNYYGVEYNEDLIKFANSQGLKVKHCDLTKDKLPFKDNTFDVVWFRHVIEHLQVREQVSVMQEIYRVLKKDGVVIVFGPTPYNWFFWDNCTHVRPCTHGQLETLAKDCKFMQTSGYYSLTRSLSHKWQKWLRLTPLRWFLWETYMVAKK